MERLGRRSNTIIAVLAGVLAGACTGPLVGVTVVDERTALENQVLGSYEELTQEVLLMASVRYINPEGQLVKQPPLPPGKKDAIRAMQRSAFNKDDVDRLKAQGVLGENNQGGITIVAPDKIEPGREAFVRNLVDEENADRRILMERIVATNEKLSPADLPQVRRTFAALNRDRARPGALIQLDNGQWTPKPEG